MNPGTKFFGLPMFVKELIKKHRGINELYDWQIECLTLEAVIKKHNLIYSLPTSGGKTLVAEILMLKEILLFNKNVIFVLPFVAIVQEKISLLSSFGLELGFFIEEYSGSKGIYPPPKRKKKKSVYICTIEKALGLVNSLIEENRINDIGLVVVDELHLIGESKRGALLENLLTKLLHLTVQIVGMSATIGNMKDLAMFLQAEIYFKDFRPIQLQEYIKVEDEVYLVKPEMDPPLEFYKRIRPENTSEEKRDPDNIGLLVKEILPESSCLVFCPSKSNCENVALMICDTLRNRVYVEHKMREKEDLLKALMAEGSGHVCPVLRKTLRYGVAYHHSGLTAAERKLLEEAYVQGTVGCICCTSTLAAGVNLPAQRVILRSPYIGTQFINLSRYRQMIGRAGRAGLGEKGDSFLLCKPMDTARVGNLLTSPMDICKTQLLGEELNNFILSLISLGLATDKSSIMKFVKATLLNVQAKHLEINIEDEVENVLFELDASGALQNSSDSIKLTSLAKAAVKGNFSYSLAKQVYDDLLLAQKCVVLEGDLHLIFLVTPYAIIEQYMPKYDVLFSVYNSLGPKELNVAKAVGIDDLCIHQILAGRQVSSVPPKILQRFFFSLVIYDLWRGNNIWEVSSKFQLSRGQINNLLAATSSFSAAIIRFCEVLEELWCFTKLFSLFPEKLDHCGAAELIELLELPAVKLGRAKQLYNAGYKDLACIAKSEPRELVLAIHHLPLKQAKQIVSVAKLLLLTKFESLQEEAEMLLQGTLKN